MAYVPGVFESDPQSTTKPPLNVRELLYRAVHLFPVEAPRHMTEHPKLLEHVVAMEQVDQAA